MPSPQLEGSNHQIFFKSKEGYTATKNRLMENKAKFFTYTFPSEKTTSLLIPGLDHIYFAQEVTENRKTQGISSVLCVKPFLTSKAKQEGRKLSLWLVTLDASHEIDDIAPVNRSMISLQLGHFGSLRTELLTSASLCQM